MHNYFYYYFYSIVSGIALCVHLIINWHQLVNRPNARAHIGALDFRRFVACLTIYFVTDVLWGVFAALKWPHGFYFRHIQYWMQPVWESTTYWISTPSSVPNSSMASFFIASSIIFKLLLLIVRA